MKKKIDKDTLRNFSIDFENLKKEYLSCADNILNSVASIFFTFYPTGKNEAAYHTGSLRDGLASYATFVDGLGKHPDIRIEFSEGKITLSERKTAGSISFEEKISWTSIKAFRKGFRKFLLFRKKQK